MKKRILMLVAVAAAGVVWALALGTMDLRPSGRLQRLHDPIVRGVGDWQENPVLAQKFPSAHAVLDGNLYGIVKSVPDRTRGINYFDGNTTYNGAKLTAGIRGFIQLWPDATNSTMYGATLQTVKWIDGTVTNDSFVAGELVTQTNSGATGYWIRNDATLGVVIQFLAGTFTNTAVDTITGATGVFTPDGVTAVVSDDRYVLHYMATPTDNTSSSVPVIEGGDKMGLPGYFVDAGAIPDLTNKQTLFWIASDGAEASFTPELWYNHPADNTTWTRLFSLAASSVGHLHGGAVVRDVNGVADAHKFMIFCGDTDNQSSIMVCDDIADLVGDGAQWKINWGFDQAAGAARNTFLTTGAGAPFVIGHGEQRFRMIQLAVDTDERYAYYIPDANETATNFAQKMDLVANTVLELASANISGPGNVALTCSNGAILLAAFSDSTGGTYDGSADKYLRLYCIDETKLDVKQVWARERIDSASPNNGSIWYFNMLEYPVGDTSVQQPSMVWLDGTGGFYLPRDGTVVGHYYPRGLGHQTYIPRGTLFAGHAYAVMEPLVNLLENGRFWNSALPNLVIDDTDRMVMLIDTTTVDLLGGNDVSLKMTPLSGEAGRARVGYTLPNEIFESLRGQWVTAHARCLWTTGTSAAKPNLVVSDGVTDFNDNTRALTNDAAWFTMETEAFVDPDATGLTIYMWCRGSGSGTDVIYYSDLALTLGCNKGRTPINTVSARVPYADPLNRMNVLMGDVRAFYPFTQTAEAAAILEYNDTHPAVPSKDIATWDTIPTLVGSKLFYTFDGVDEEMDIVDHADFTFGDGTNDSPFTVGAWINPTTASAGARKSIFCKQDETAVVREWMFELNNADKLSIKFYDESTNAWMGKTKSVAAPIGTTAAWYFVVTTYSGVGDSTGIKMYINGAEDTVFASFDNQVGTYTAMEDTATKPTIGFIQQGGAGNYFFKGAMTMVFVTGTELNAAAVKELYEVSRKLLNK